METIFTDQGFMVHYITDQKCFVHIILHFWGNPKNHKHYAPSKLAAAQYAYDAAAVRCILHRMTKSLKTWQNPIFMQFSGLVMSF